MLALLLTFFLATTCSPSADQFIAQYPAIYAAAGSPAVVCGEAPGAWTGVYNHRTRTITIEDGTRLGAFAHELGHAWVYANALQRLDEYAAIRGFPGDGISTEVMEDYAETFAFALGLWEPHGAGPPYEFKNVAGVPTPKQLRKLKKAGLLPTEKRPAGRSVWQ